MEDCDVLAVTCHFTKRRVYDLNPLVHLAFGVAWCVHPTGGYSALGCGHLL